jgi:ATP-dependent protease HslVU (ClpYQ) ATPase subunit
MHSKNLFSSTSKLYQQIRDDIRKKLEKYSQEHQESLRLRAEQIKKESLLSTFIIDDRIHDSQNKTSSLTNNPSESNKHELTLKEFKKAIKNLSVQHCEILIRIKKETNKPLDYIPWNTTDLFAESGKQLKRKRSYSCSRSKDNLE